jgi:hypothetical protein
MAAMRMLALTATVLVLSMGAQAKVWMTVYRCDEKTPLTPVDPNQPHVYGDIMVGTKLVVVVDSDSGSNFVGFLRFPDDGVMSLDGRGCDANSQVYVDSVLPAAGPEGQVRLRDSTGHKGFGLMTDFFPSLGDWFIFDYCAEQVGSCILEIYDSADGEVFVDALCFTHIASCDFNGDSRIDFEDFALLASCYSPIPGTAANDQSAFDLNSDRMIDFRDLAHFSEHWLERISCDDPPEDPNQST